MSLMNTVTKMAIGFAVAKGMEAVQKKGGLGNVMDSISGEARQAGGMGGLGDILGQLGGGASAGSAGAAGSLGGLLGGLGGGASGGAGGGLAGMLGQLAGGGGAAAGGLGGLGGLLGGLAGARGGAAGAGLEALINQDNPADEPDEDDMARLMLRAMCHAARADGDIDANEKANLLEVLKDGDPSNIEVVQQILEEPVSAQAIASATPRGLETQVYTMSLNAISPDNQAEGQYLHSLAQAMGLDPQMVNQIHDGLGAPRLYG